MPVVEQEGLLACVTAAARLGWGGARWAAVILMPAGPAHRSKVASALLADAGQHGRVFRMANGDKVLLAPTDLALRTGLGQLYPDDGQAVTWLDMPAGQGALLAYARAHADGPARPGPRSTPLRRHTAVLAGNELTPCYLEISTGHPNARLEAADLPELLAQLTTWIHLRPNPALHVALSQQALRTSAFADFADDAAAVGLKLGASVPLLSAVADPEGWRAAAAAARHAGAALVVDGVTHGALSLIDPGALGPDLIKLTWSPEMIEGGPNLVQSVRQTGPDRIVLDGADTETAIKWGLIHGIRRFQGRHVDVMLATGRMAACFAADACTVRQCADRAHATSPAGRTGCRNPAQLGEVA